MSHIYLRLLNASFIVYITDISPHREYINNNQFLLFKRKKKKFKSSKRFDVIHLYYK